MNRHSKAIGEKPTSQNGPVLDPVETAVRRAWERERALKRMHPVVRQSAGARLIEQAMQREVERLDG